MKKTGMAGIFAASLELTREGIISISQKKLFDNQSEMNKSLVNLKIKVLVENRTNDKSKLSAASVPRLNIEKT